MNKYENGKIYKLVGENELWYIGSTIKPLNYRFSDHYRNMNCMSRHLVNPTIHLLEDYPCNNKNELRMREQYYLNKYRDKCINQIRSYRSKEEKKEQEDNACKKYREKNKERKREKIECECGKKIRKDCIARHRKTISHKNKIIENNINGQSTTTSDST